MVNTSRILTVSYGTFSCTLEGFDDPFSTMRSIAEYFRDLAADDRYFGAEPPTPDAEMLHRIAEREIQRRVEAKVSEHGVILRQTDDDAVAAPAGLIADSAADEAAREAEAQAARDAEQAKADAARKAAEEDARKAAEEEAARKAAEEEAERKAAEAAEAARKAAEEEAARKAAEEAARKAEEEAKAAEAARAQAEAEEAARRAEEEARAAAEAEEADQPVAGSVTDKLMRIRAVVDNGDGDFLEDENGEEYFADLSDEYEDVLEDALTGGDEQSADDDNDAISAVLGSLTHPAVMEEDEVIVADEAGADEDDDDVASLIAGLDENDADIAEDEAEAAADADAPAPDARPRPVARVIKVRRPMPAKPAEAEYEDEDDGFAVPGESTLSDEDEADLAAELAEVARATVADHDEAERAAYADEDEEDEATEAGHDPLAIDEADEMPADRIEVPHRAPLRTAFDEHELSDTDTAVDRILAKTNTQLESGEASRRRSAIQHLKQAVQATRADGDAPSKDEEEQEAQDAYRADLARVVRPRRPDAGDMQGKRPHRRLAPLVLVSEQRIDEPADATASEPAQPVSPVRPRRVAAGNLAVARDIDEDELDGDAEADATPMVAGFRAFLDHQDAEGYDDVVEAGVAFFTQEVGRANVTRPQLMTLVRSTMPDMSREEGLRAFGKLLRDGRITKVKRGIFVLSKKSRFFDADA
ncbi:hypothetical protein [Sinisalibacter aestuarii]|uniref:Lipoprotein n=1 Tax=Sinisalibacter aestuarii TaxID=2949426 RepID=A0ABQ5LV47_9RHOB|nr:hypothetical protein [Sinisalibacter aestuarii]GKY88648.1 hypothetical protein STA1M1_25170 [Sinisalibacter aestuarii]